MRLSSLALPAVMTVMAGSALAQNAISLWRSDLGNAGLSAIGVGGTTANGGGVVAQTMPADVLTYFRPNLGARELDFIGFETLWQSGATINQILPTLELQRALENPAAPARLLPEEAFGGYTPLFQGPIGASLGVIPAGARIHVGITGPGVAVPAGTANGGGLAAVVKGYQSQAGVNGLTALFTTTGNSATGNETYTDQTDCLTVIKLPGNPTYFYLTQLFLGAFPVVRTEWAVTYLFRQSMIQPVKNNFQATSGSPIPGGGTVPGGVFAFSGDNGAGALRPNAGDVISYSANTSTIALGQANAPWFIPFALFDGTADTTFPNPAPENWNNPGKSSNTYVYKQLVSDYIDDIITAFGGTFLVGNLLAPNQPTQAIWFGVDLPTLFNLQVLIEAIGFADISGGPQWAGPAIPALDTVLQPGGILLRNGINDGAKIAEHVSLLTPQTGFTAFNPVGNFLGFGANPGGALAGKSFAVQCWVLDTASTTTVSNYHIVDMTNAIKITLGN